MNDGLRTPWALGFVLVVGAVAGCSSDDEEGTGPIEDVTYWQSVAPIYADKCVQCHQAGGIAPFALDSYDSAVNFAAAAKAAVQSRRMPPYLVTADGSCGDFSEPWALSSQEIAVISQWADGTMDEGTPRTDIVPKALPTLGDTAVSVTTPEFVPQIVGGPLAEFDEYRCFLLDPQVTEDTFLTGFEVIPGNAAMVHHVLGFPVELDRDVGGQTNAEVMAALDAQSPDRAGWPCFNMAGEGVAVDGVPVTWAPGTGAVRYPGGTGIEFPAGAQIVVQVHYNLVSEELRGQSDSSTVRLAFEDNVQRLGFFDLQDEFLDSRLEGNPVSIPAGQASFEYQFEFDYDDVLGFVGGSIDIAGVFPHMHERGRTLRIERIRGGQSACVANVDRWDFNWQLIYLYQTPIQLRTGDRLRVTCTYNTEGLTGPTLPGWGTQNEMCLAGLLLSLPPGLGL